MRKLKALLVAGLLVPVWPTPALAQTATPPLEVSGGAIAPTGRAMDRPA